MAYLVDRVVICDAYQEPDAHYQLQSGGRVPAGQMGAVPPCASSPPPRTPRAELRASSVGRRACSRIYPLRVRN